MRKRTANRQWILFSIVRQVAIRSTFSLEKSGKKLIKRNWRSLRRKTKFVTKSENSLLIKDVQVFFRLLPLLSVHRPYENCGIFNLSETIICCRQRWSKYAISFPYHSLYRKMNVTSIEVKDLALRTTEYFKHKWY